MFTDSRNRYRKIILEMSINFLVNNAFADQDEENSQ